MVAFGDTAVEIAKLHVSDKIQVTGKLNSSERICYFNSLDLLKSNLYGQLELNRCQECKKCNTVCPVGLDIVKILWNDVWEIRT